LFGEAVELHEQLLRDQAAARYEQALSHWDNPHIRWNLALVMMDMGQYLRAHEHVERALSWGAEAFDPPDWEKLTGMQQRLLRQHLAVIEVRCDQPDAELALDGKSWFRGPGAARQVVLPGEHVITARRPGYFPLARNVVLPAGTQGAVTVAMSVDGIFEKRRWASWKPWTVLGSSLAVGAMGTGLYWHARWQLDAARDELADDCGERPHCPPETPPAYRRSEWEARVATGTIAVAGTAAAAGLVLLFLNQPRAYRTENREGGVFQLVPIASPDTAGVSARLRF
jgi:tetratricopeptide (TPR) repeat protein